MPPKPKAKADSTTDIPAQPTASQEAAGVPWDQEVWACRYTYLALLANEQFTEQFSLVGNRGMKDLNFWNKVASPGARSLAAGGLATNIDKMYTQILPHTHEEGYNFHRAIEDMRAALLTEDKTVAELAQEIDSIYLWRGETH